MLTKKQRDLLLFIHETMSGDDVPPSFEEMKDALGLKSKSGIHRLISALVERGYIERLPHRARALRIKKLPDGFKPSDHDLSEAAKVAREIFITQSAAAQVVGFDEIPLYGRIAAGTPIEAVRDEGAVMQLPPGMVGKGEHYALTIDGDSMMNAGIHDQDTVIIRRCDTAENGEIIVALVDDLEVTLKRIQKEKGKIILIPENDAYEPRTLDASRVKVQGKLASLIRSYN
jgi:repressor LexA